MKKPRFTLEQHEKLGKELHIIRDRIQQISTELDRAYPNSMGFFELTSKAVKNIDNIRNKMDSAVFNEVGKDSMHDLCKVYYPGSNAITPEYSESSLVVSLNK